MLLLTALIWGCSFVAQSEAMDNVGPFTFQMCRSLLGAMVVFPMVLINYGRKKARQYPEPGSETETEAEAEAAAGVGIKAGLICGLVFCAASLTQQFGILHTDSIGKAAFITAMYIVLVPCMGIFTGRRVPPRIWFCVALGVAGIYLISVKEAMIIGRGDLILMCCALLFALQILLVDHYVKEVDGILISFMQMLVTTVISGVGMAVFEKPHLNDVVSAAAPILYAGAGSSGIAYTLQIQGQKYTKPAVASLIMSLESVFALLAGIVLLHQYPDVREWAGIALMFTAIILS